MHSTLSQGSSDIGTPNEPTSKGNHTNPPAAVCFPKGKKVSNLEIIIIYYRSVEEKVSFRPFSANLLIGEK